MNRYNARRPGWFVACTSMVLLGSGVSVAAADPGSTGPVLRVMVVPRNPPPPQKTVRAPQIPAIDVAERVERALRMILPAQSYSISHNVVVAGNKTYDRTLPFWLNAQKIYENTPTPLQVLIETAVVQTRSLIPGSPRKKLVTRLEGVIKNINPSQQFDFALILTPQQATKRKGRWVLMGSLRVAQELARLVRKNVEPLYQVAPPPLLIQSQPPPPVPVLTPPVAMRPAEVDAGTLAPAERPVRQERDDRENPVLKILPEKKKRHPWWPLFEVRAGYGRYGRRLEVNGLAVFPAEDAGSTYAEANGMYLSGAVYPFAAMKHIHDMVANLGVQLDVMLPLWGTSEAPPPMPSVSLSLSEVRVEPALHWRSQFFNRAWRPELEVDVRYIYHSFDVYGAYGQRNPPFSTLPSVESHSLGGRAGLRLFASRFVDLGAHGMVAQVLALNHITNKDQYGPGSAWLWRADAELGVNLWGFTVGGQFFYEQNRMTFGGTGQLLPLGPKGGRARDAVDTSLGVLVTVGYTFSPPIHPKREASPAP